MPTNRIANSYCLVCGKGYYCHPSQKGKRRTCSLVCREILWVQEGHRPPSKTCKICGKQLPRNSRITCSMKCRSVHFKRIGKKPPPPIKYGQKHNRGYVLIAIGNGYIREHRIIAEQMIGRPLEKEEVVHHLNGNKSDNCPENLIVMNYKEHNHFHAVQPRKPHLEGYYKSQGEFIYFDDLPKNP